MEEEKIIKNPMNAESGHSQPDHTSPGCQGFKDMSIKVFRGHGKAEAGMRERQAPEKLMVMVLHDGASADGDGKGTVQAGPDSAFLSLLGRRHEPRAVLREGEQGTPPLDSVYSSNWLIYT